MFLSFMYTSGDCIMVYERARVVFLKIIHPSLVQTLPDELQTPANFIISVDRDLSNLQPFEKLI